MGEEGKRKIKFARVIGTVVATGKYKDLEGIEFLVMQLLDEALNLWFGPPSPPTPRPRPVLAS